MDQKLNYTNSDFKIFNLTQLFTIMYWHTPLNKRLNVHWKIPDYISENSLLISLKIRENYYCMNFLMNMNTICWSGITCSKSLEASSRTESEVGISVVTSGYHFLLLPCPLPLFTPGGAKSPSFTAVFIQCIVLHYDKSSPLL